MRADYAALRTTVRAQVAKWQPEQQMAWSERAAILEYDAGYDRPEAEVRAYWELRTT